MATNTAAWIVSHNAHPFEIKPAPLYTPGENEVLVKNHAVAVNPIDLKLQTSDRYKEKFAFPTIYGQDVAGEVVAVGPNVTNFKKGDRVAGLPPGFLSNKSEHFGFQAYVLLSTALLAKIPDSLSYEKATVIPLGLSTAAAGLFDPDQLGLQVPTEPAQESTGQTVLVWGGASSVGSSAVQLAIAAGFRVISTASPKNFDKVKQLGASHVFDYNSASVVSDLLEAAKGTQIAGIYDAIGPAAWKHVQEFAKLSEGNKFITTVVPGWPEPPAGVTLKQLGAFSIAKNHVAQAVWGEYLPRALAAGTFVPAPEPWVFGKGLESVQGAVDYLGQNATSAQKVVVLLE